LNAVRSAEEQQREQNEQAELSGEFTFIFKDYRSKAKLIFVASNHFRIIL
jgi:hypothetical protein